MCYLAPKEAPHELVGVTTKQLEVLVPIYASTSGSQQGVLKFSMTNVTLSYEASLNTVLLSQESEVVVSQEHEFFPGAFRFDGCEFFLFFGSANMFFLLKTQDS